ncbi:carbonic anhydrase 2-like [Erythrolamprus reginae]|uniref:carbonic anhydrase 2-like n=1 Tax=Erythrolamprus reginae TaxID=121349 RepID=UPI00396C40DB
MGSVGLPLKLSVCILIFLILENFCVTCNEEPIPWCYDLPKVCGPDTWGPLGSCNGKNQSPININTRSVISKPAEKSLYFKNYGDRNLLVAVKNTGHQAQLMVLSKATISGGDLTEPYTLQQAHLHWGTIKNSGAEHTIDGRRHTMEMHLVHTINNMSVEEASKLPNGLVVVGIFLQKSEKNDHPTAWNTLARLCKKIPEKGDSYNLSGELTFGALLSRVDFSRYYTYQGSLTTPPCAESVKWLIIADYIEVSSEVVSLFTGTLFFTTKEEGRRMQNTFRPTQPLNDRKVYYYREYNTWSGCLRSCVRKQF